MAVLSPPFTASDMQGLYNKIIKGQYPNIPSIYSQDLSNIIRSMLQVNPAVRPSCSTILEMPPVLRHINPGPVIEEEKNQLLGTIKFDPNLHNLNKKLPEDNYEKKSRVGSADVKRMIGEQPRGRISSAKGERQPINQLQMMQEMLISPPKIDPRQQRALPRQESDYRGGPRVAPRPDVKEVYDPRYNQRPNAQPLSQPEPHPLYRIPPKSTPNQPRRISQPDPFQANRQPQKVGGFILENPAPRQEQVPDYRNQIRAPINRRNDIKNERDKPGW